MKKFTPTTLIALLISASVFSQMKNEPVKIPSGGTTVNQASNSKIILLSPADGKLFSDSEGSKPILFRWSAIVPKPKEAVTYRLKVWQLLEGQNSTEAMRNNQPIVSKEVVNITQAAVSNLYTGPCRPPYLCDFVWAVEVLNSDGVTIGNSYATTSLFKFEVENVTAKNTKYGNPANPGSYGMSGGKSLSTDGDSGYKYKTYQPGKPIYGNISQSGDGESEIYSFEYGVKAPKDQSTGHSSGKSLDKEVDKGQPTYVIDLPIEKIMYDATGNITGIMLKTEKGESLVVKVVVTGSNSLSGGVK